MLTEILKPVISDNRHSGIIILKEAIQEALSKCDIREYIVSILEADSGIKIDVWAKNDTYEFTHCEIDIT